MTQQQLIDEIAKANSTGSVSPNAHITIPNVRKVFPQLITNEIVGVQPMQGPVGLSFAFTPKYSTGVPVPLKVKQEVVIPKKPDVPDLRTQDERDIADKILG